MSNYNVKSLKAEEFISDSEILETIKYAEENKNNIELINSILEKARPRKTENGTVCAGLNHREASVLLACEDENITKEMYSLAEQIKKDMHVTAQEYIKNKMIAHAQVLLRQTNMTINEIAEELGFKYPNHFTRMFHSSTGYTPLKYRKGN